MIVKKDGISLNLNQLSDGEKCTIALLGDLARRLAMANPTLENKDYDLAEQCADDIDDLTQGRNESVAKVRILIARDRRNYEKNNTFD